MRFVQYYIILLSGSLFLAPDLYADSKAQKAANPQNLEQQWLNKFEHKNAGCPINSQCTKQMGAKISRWTSFLKQVSGKKNRIARLEKFRQKNGIPINFWTKQDAFDLFSPVLWDSPCPHHRLKGKRPVLIGQAFIADNSKTGPKIILDKRKSYNIDNAKLFSFDPIYVQFKNKIRKYMIPINDVPSHTQGQKLFVLKEYLGHYYNLLIDPQGKWKIAPVARSVPFGENVKCPESLVKKAMAEFPQGELYKSYYCKQLYDAKTKQFNSMLVRWSCN